MRLSTPPIAPAATALKSPRRQFFDLVANRERNIARGSASFVIVPPGLETQLDGIFLISLDAQGRCKSLQEWWHKHQK
jgi:hypothetical protein